MKTAWDLIDIFSINLNFDEEVCTLSLHLLEHSTIPTGLLVNLYQNTFII